MVNFTDIDYATADINIGNLNWKVTLTDNYCSKLYDPDDNVKKIKLSDVAMGRCWKTLCHIYVTKDMAEGNLRRTIMHEITHAVIYTYAMMVSSDAMDEEEICNFMEIHCDKIRDLTEQAYKVIHPKFVELMNENS